MLYSFPMDSMKLINQQKATDGATQGTESFLTEKNRRNSFRRGYSDPASGSGADVFVQHVAGSVSILDFVPVADGADDLNRRGIFQLGDPVGFEIRTDPHVDLLAVRAVHLRGEGLEIAAGE